MLHIVLTAEQMLVLEKATTAVELRDETRGVAVGQLPAPTEVEIIERIKRDRSVNFPRYPAKQVEERLRLPAKRKEVP